MSETLDTEAKFQIPELDIATTLKIKGGIADIELEACPKLWSPSEPKLYQVSLSCMEDTVSDEVKSYKKPAFYVLQKFYRELI